MDEMLGGKIKKRRKGAGKNHNLRPHDMLLVQVSLIGGNDK